MAAIPRGKPRSGRNVLLFAFPLFLGFSISLTSVLSVMNSVGMQHHLEGEFEPPLMDVNVEGLKKTEGAEIEPPAVLIPDVLDILKELSKLSGGDSIGDLECPPPLVPFHDRVVTTPHAIEATGTARKIPRIIHVSMQSRCIPRDIDMFMDRWKVQFPDYSIFFHDDDAVKRLIHQEWAEFPDLHRALQCVKYKGAMTIDIWRVLMLYKYGGLYTDIDNWAMDNFNETVIEPDLSAFFFSDAWDRPSQWFMATEPRHPMMYMAMNQIISNVLNMKHIFKPKVVFVTGPMAVKNAYALFHYEEALEDKMRIFEGGVHTGMHGKKTKKIGKAALPFITSKYNYAEIVPFNATLNITRGERIVMESDVMHWTKKVFKSSKVAASKISCKDYLKKLDEGGNFTTMTF
jgi:hypothetical protein